MIYREISPGEFAPWNGERLADGLLLNPRDALRLSEAELAALGLYVPVEAAPVPEGKIAISTAVDRIDGVVTFVHTLEDAPDPIDPTPSASIVANVLLKNEGGVLNGIETSCGFSMAFALGPGSYLLFFTESQPDTAYTYGLGCSSGLLNVVARDVDYIELLATDGGVPADPAEISIQINRVS